MRPLSVVSSSNPSRCYSRKEKLLKNETAKQCKEPLVVVHFLASSFLTAFLTLSAPAIGPSVSFAQPAFPNGAALFQKACIGCHDMGGNILQPGATLFMKDLERNGIQTEEDIYNITYYGKGRMPGFGERCTPRGQCTFGPRLQEEEIKQLAEFVKLQAQGDG
ncbi:hypothetical protein HPP92_015379 [Vanilla planifolia]|uniref:Cytochrome c-553 n=1 Tax=Vanilla planifolia TaxID=51239 RepID=A0A835QQ07_VANPL|nr:hypothetical protein HPP92_015379 [Vanilla planifolia]